MADSKKVNVVFLQDKELVLRPAREDDAALIQKWVCDPEIRRLYGTHWPQTLDDTRAKLAKLKDDKSQLLLVIEVRGRPIGTMGLRFLEWKDRRATSMTVIGEKVNRGKRYGRRAKKLLLTYVFEELGLNKVSSSVIEFNEASIRYSLACGYKKEGRIREHFFRDGRFWDEIRLGITRADWNRFNRK